MLNNKQVEDFLHSLNLKFICKYGSENTESNSTCFCVYDKQNNVAFEYNPFANWIKDCRCNNQKHHFDTVTKFKKMCKELSEE